MEPNNNTTKEPNTNNKKLTFIEKLIIKKELKKLNKQIKKDQQQKKNQTQKIKQCIKQSLNELNIEHKGKQLTKKEIDKLPQEELTEIFKDIIKTLKKMKNQ